MSVFTSSSNILLSTIGQFPPRDLKYEVRAGQVSRRRVTAGWRESHLVHTWRNISRHYITTKAKKERNSSLRDADTEKWLYIFKTMVSISMHVCMHYVRRGTGNSILECHRLRCWVTCKQSDASIIQVRIIGCIRSDVSYIQPILNFPGRSLELGVCHLPFHRCLHKSQAAWIVRHRTQRNTSRILETFFYFPNARQATTVSHSNVCVSFGTKITA